MKALKHEQARYYLHIGHENLGEAEQESLKRHLTECHTCQSYATELDALQSTLSCVMRAQWDAFAPASIAEDKIQSRIQRKIVQRRVLRLTVSTTSAAVVLGLIVVVVWFFQPPALVPVSPGSGGVSTRVNQTARIADYPLALNNTWVYQATRYEGFNSGAVMTATSTITETVIEIKTAPDYDVAKIRRETSAEKPIAGPEDLKQLARAAESSEYWLVVTSDRIYRQEANSDLEKLTDQDSLEFQFPLKPGERWTWNPARLPNTPDQIGGISRQVLQVGTVQVPAGTFDGCFLIQDGWTTDTSVNWFCPKIGWVERKSDHNGTPYGSHQVLTQYRLSSRPPSVPTRVNQTFGNTITLLGFGLSQDHLAAGDTVAVTLYWQARVATKTSYAVFIHLQHGDEDGGLVAQRDSIPVNGTRPTTSWRPDEVIEDRQELVLPGTLAPGQYNVVLGLYDPSSGVRLKTSEGKNALTLATVNVSPLTATSNSSPTPTGAAFPTEIYPPPVLVAPGIVFSNLSSGCPNPDGLEQAQELPASAVNEVFRSLASGDLDSMRRVVDPAYWPYLPDLGVGTARQFSQGTLEKPEPASASPYADLVGNACGRKTLELSWWVKACPGPCNDANVAREADLMAHYYLIRRRGHWLVWAIR